MFGCFCSCILLEKEVVAWVKDNFDNLEPINCPINLCCHFYKEKQFHSDLVGYLQAIQDALVKARLLEDDNHEIVMTTDGSQVFLDKQNPRIEVGKYSVGWKFLFQKHPFINSKSDLDRFLETGVIHNEYNDPITLTDFKLLVERHQNDMEHLELGHGYSEIDGYDFLEGYFE